MSRDAITMMRGSWRASNIKLANCRAINAELVAALKEFVRLDEESELRATSGNDLVVALHDARAAIAKT